MKYLIAVSYVLVMGNSMLTTSCSEGQPNISSNKRIFQAEDLEGITDEVVRAVIQIESGGNPRAERYEKHIKDTSYGLMQILTTTAKQIEKRHPALPRLGNTQNEIKDHLCDPRINQAYGKTHLQELFEYYGDIELAVAGYNAGFFAPRNARVQQQLNDLVGTNLSTDGIFGQQSKNALRTFQAQYGLDGTGRYDAETKEALQKKWKQKHPSAPNPKGIIPKNNITPYHVEKFRIACQRIKRA